MIALPLFRTELEQTVARPTRPRRFLAGLQNWQARRAAQVIHTHAHLLAAPGEEMDFRAGGRASAASRR